MSGLHYVAVCCTMLQCVVVCCSVLHCVALCCTVSQNVAACVAVCCSVWQCGAVCCSALQCVAVRCGVKQRVAAYCSALQCVTVCCSVYIRDLISQEPYIPLFVCHMTHSNDLCCSVLQCVAVRYSVLQCIYKGPHITRALHPTICVWHDWFEWPHIFTCHMTHSRVTWPIQMWLDTFTCDLCCSVLQCVAVRYSVLQCIYKGPHITRALHPTICVWHDWFEWPHIFTCHMTHSRVTWPIQMWLDTFTCDMTHSCVTWPNHMWHDTFTCDMTHHASVTWLIHVWHDSFMHHVTHHLLSQKKVARQYTGKTNCILIHTSACLQDSSFVLCDFFVQRIWVQRTWASLKATCMPSHLHCVCHANSPLCAMKRAVYVNKRALHVFKWDMHATSYQPSVPSKEAYCSSKEPYIYRQAPCMPSNDAYIQKHTVCHDKKATPHQTALTALYAIK